MKRADPDQPAVRRDEACSTPKGVGGCGKDRVVEHVFPIAGKFLTGDDPRRDGVTATALGGHDRAIAGADAYSDPEIDRRNVQFAQGLDETEAGLLVVGEDMTRYGTATGGGEPDRLGLGDEIADGQDEAVLADQYTAAGAFGAERPGREGVLRNRRPQA